jgi:hypothetical protein
MIHSTNESIRYYKEEYLQTLEQGFACNNNSKPDVGNCWHKNHIEQKSSLKKN